MNETRQLCLSVTRNMANVLVPVRNTSPEAPEILRLDDERQTRLSVRTSKSYFDHLCNVQHTSAACTRLCRAASHVVVMLTPRQDPYAVLYTILLRLRCSKYSSSLVTGTSVGCVGTQSSGSGRVAAVRHTPKHESWPPRQPWPAIGPKYTLYIALRVRVCDSPDVVYEAHMARLHIVLGAELPTLVRHRPSERQAKSCIHSRASHLRLVQVRMSGSGYTAVAQRQHRACSPSR